MVGTVWARQGFNSCVSTDVGFYPSFLNATIRTERTSMRFLFRMGQNVIFHVRRMNGGIKAVGTLRDRISLGKALSSVVGGARPNHLRTARVRPHL